MTETSKRQGLFDCFDRQSAEFTATSGHAGFEERRSGAGILKILAGKSN
jgi:hypothetical protein